MHSPEGYTPDQLVQGKDPTDTDSFDSDVVHAASDTATAAGPKEPSKT